MHGRRRTPQHRPARRHLRRARAGRHQRADRHRRSAARQRPARLHRRRRGPRRQVQAVPGPRTAAGRPAATGDQGRLRGGQRRRDSRRRAPGVSPGHVRRTGAGRRRRAVQPADRDAQVQQPAARAARRAVRRSGLQLRRAAAEQSQAARRHLRRPGLHGLRRRAGRTSRRCCKRRWPRACRARACISECHPLAVGWGYGPQGTRTAEQAFKHVDLVLAIGVRYSEVSTAFYAIPPHRTSSTSTPTPTTSAASSRPRSASTPTPASS